MKFIRLLMAEAGDGRARLMVVSLLPGFVMAVVIALVTTVSDYNQSEGLHIELMAYFALGCATVLWTMNMALNAMTVLVAGLLDRTRVGIAEQVRGLNLTSFERIGRVRIDEVLGRDMQTMEETAPHVVALAFFVMQILASALYIGYLSILAFAVTISLFAVAAYFYRRSYSDAEELWREATDSETAFRASLDQLLSGFRETKLHARRSQDLFSNYIVTGSRTVDRLRVESGQSFNYGQSISDLFFYALMGAIVFAVPYYIVDQSTPSKITLVIVFSSGAVASVIRTLPMVARANLAVENLERLEHELKEQHRVSQDAEVQDYATLKQGLEAKGITYTYRDPEGGIAFSLGPCDFEIKAGEIVFIVGGNGSGKSTLIKLLTYLYEPAAGTIFWDGTPISTANAEIYRGLFSVIFSDFHLFDRLYGIENQDQSEVDRLLETMRLGDKVAYRDGRFIKTELSTGQRKRLAMVVARLENRPVCIFDEWAADQDPEYRKYYYETLLPLLKAEGRTIIASTHDDRYFHIADKVIWMEEGRIERIETGA